MPPGPRTNSPVLELRRVTKFFGDLAALKEVSLRIEPGDSALLYGPNGAGKTTLLRILANLARPTSGELIFAGRSTAKAIAEAKAAIGFASHASFLYGELTVRENLEFFGALYNLKDRERNIARVLELFSLRDRERVLVRELSRGLQQRATLARAFLHDPMILLLDEPFTGLDAQSAANLETILRRLPGEGKALVFSSHDFSQGASIARRLVALRAGRVRYDGALAAAPFEALHIRRAPEPLYE